MHTFLLATETGLDAHRACRRSVLITDVHISGADCIGILWVFLLIW